MPRHNRGLGGRIPTFCSVSGNGNGFTGKGCKPHSNQPDQGWADCWPKAGDTETLRE